MPQILAIVFAAAFVVVLVRHILLRRELARMADAMAETHDRRDTRQLTIGTQQREVARLAVAINTLYDDVDADRAANRTAIDEVRQSMTNISHDLRTPLTSVLGYLKLLRKEGNAPEQNEHYLDVAYTKAEALNRLVGGLFELARLESGGYTFEPKRLDAAALLAEELAGAYTQLEERGLLPEVELAEGGLFIVGDGDALRRVFANLLQNMVKHGAAPMRVYGGGEDGRAVFRFSNPAPALTQADAAQLFDRFFTADRMRSGKDTGLGLAIVQEFTRQMNGTATAQLADGTLTFTVSFPLTV